jgi:hypothetical protein
MRYAGVFIINNSHFRSVNFVPVFRASFNISRYHWGMKMCCNGAVILLSNKVKLKLTRSLKLSEGIHEWGTNEIQ